jgi:superoxide dismutase, Cu-Zn family
MMRSRNLLTTLVPLALLVACGGGAETQPDPTMGPTEPPPAPPAEPAVAEAPEPEPAEPPAPAEPEKIEASIQAKSGSKLAGTVTLEKVDNGVRVHILVENLKPGLRATHIHETGDCSAPDATSAGSHFSPEGHPHGLPPAEKRHLGDLGNIEVGKDGKGELEIVVEGATLEEGGSHSFRGKALIVHAKKDDGGQPVGNAGGRIGCAELVP